MDRVTVDLKHCYGIKALKKELDFSSAPAYAIYAPNGVMKSSLAQTFQDAANEVASKDRIFPTRGLSCNGVKNYSKGPCVTILE